MFHGHPERKRMSLRGCLKSPANAKFTERGIGFIPVSPEAEVTKLIAHLFVDRSDNLLIGNHIKKSLPDDRQPQPTEVRRKRLDRQRTGCSICHSDFFTSSLSFLSSLPAIGLCSDDCHSTCFLAGYRSLVNSSRILQLIVTIRAHCEFDPSRSATTSIHLAQLPD